MPSSIEKLLLEACRRNDFAMVEHLFASGELMNVNCEDLDELSPLVHAIDHGNSRLVRLLLRRGARVDFSSRYYHSPLLRACQVSSPDILRIILERRPRLESEYCCEESAFFSAAHNYPSKYYRRVLETLVSYGMTRRPRSRRYHRDDDSGSDSEVDTRADAGAGDVDRERLKYYQLLSFILRNDVAGAAKLLGELEDVEFHSIVEESPLYYAVLFARADIVALLLRSGARADPSIQYGRHGILQLAAERGSVGILSQLIDSGANVNGFYKTHDTWYCKPLTVAARHRHPEVLEALLQRGAVDEKNYSKDFGNSSALVAAAQAGDAECLRVLLKGRFLQPDPEGNYLPVEEYLASGLLAAIESQTFGYAEFLLRQGADPNTRDHSERDSRIPFLQACSYATTTEHIRLFLRYGADLRQVSSQGKTALHHVAESWGSTEDLVLVLSQGLIDVNARDNHGNTALHFLDEFGDSCTCERIVLMLEQGADLAIANERGDTAAYYDHETSFGCCCADLEEFIERYNAKGEFDEQQFWHKCPLVHHYKKLRLLNFDFESLPPCRLKYMFKEDCAPKPIYFVESEDDVAELRAEVAKLEGVTIDYSARLTLMDFVQLAPSKLVPYSRNNVVNQLFIECDGDFRARFPNFGFAVNLQFRRCQERRALIDRAHRVLDAVHDCEIPDFVINGVFREFSDEKLAEFGRIASDLDFDVESFVPRRSLFEFL